MKRPCIVIVGAGLGGCMLAHALADSHDVTIIERGASGSHDEFPIVDVGVPAGMDRHIGAGPGGTTQLWHNGLIEVSPESFDESWPFAKAELDSFYAQAFQLLSGIELVRVRAAIEELRQRYRALGIPGENLPGLFYPRWPLNLWEAFKLQERVTLVTADVTGFDMGHRRTCKGFTCLSAGSTAVWRAMSSSWLPAAWAHPCCCRNWRGSRIFQRFGMPGFITKTTRWASWAKWN